jgi:hypothetical protein
MGLFKRTVEKASVEHLGHQISIENYWQLIPFRSEAHLYIDGELRETNKEPFHLNPNTPLMSLKNISDSIERLDIHIIGVWSIKFAIYINDELVYRDPIDWWDKQQNKVYSKA